MYSSMTKPSHSGLIYYLSLLPQTLCSSHTELHLALQCTVPSPLAFLCAVSSPKNALSLTAPSLSPFPCYLRLKSTLTFQEPEQAFPAPGSLLWPPVLDWDDHSTWAHSHAGTPTPRHHCLFSSQTHSFLCQSLKGSYCVWGPCWMNQWIKWIKEVSWTWSVYIEKIFISFSYWIHR